MLSSRPVRSPYLRPVLILLALPAAGAVCTLAIGLFYDLGAAEPACRLRSMLARPGGAEFCGEVARIVLLRRASWLMLAVSLALPLFYLALAAVIGRSRFLLSRVFGPLVKASIVLTVVLI